MKKHLPMQISKVCRKKNMISLSTILRLMIKNILQIKFSFCDSSILF